LEIEPLRLLFETDPAAAADALDRALGTPGAGAGPYAMMDLHLLAATYWKERPQQAAFHTTHAYIYALEAGAWEKVEALHAELAQAGRI